MACNKCNGTGLVSLPRGMTSGFYNFMAPGCRQEAGPQRMLCPCDQQPREPIEEEPDMQDDDFIILDLQGKHVHVCPHCYDNVPCDDCCTWDGESRTEQGDPSCHPVICRRCEMMSRSYQDQGSGI